MLCWMETRAQLLRELGKHDEASAIYKQLLKRNPEHVGYHAGRPGVHPARPKPIRALARA